MKPPGQTEPSAGIEFYGGYQVYSETGVDLTLLRRNLQLSLEDRWQDACRGAALLEAIDSSRRAFAVAGTQRRGGTPVLDAPGVIRHLTDHHVEFVVIGGLAMITHGSAYLTKDIDLCYNRSASNVAALAAAFAPLHPYLRGAPPGWPFRFDAPTIQAGLNFTLTTDLGDVDLLGEVSGVGSYDQVFAQSEEHILFGMKARVLSLDGLIAAKKAAGRGKDRQHLLELEELKKLRDAGGPGVNVTGSAGGPVR
jgi:predicted nucleotidyltransferase